MKWVLRNGYGQYLYHVFGAGTLWSNATEATESMVLLKWSTSTGAQRAASIHGGQPARLKVVDSGELVD